MKAAMTKNETVPELERTYSRRQTETSLTRECADDAWFITQKEVLER